MLVRVTLANVALSVVTMMIVAMAHLVEPTRVSQRFKGITARWRLGILESILIVAILLRTASPLLSGIGAGVEFSIVGAAGVLAWLAVALFARSLWVARSEGAPAIS
jgi:hypothetical protein